MVLNLGRRSLDNKNQYKSNKNISINNNQLEKINSINNYLERKKNIKIISNRANSSINNERNTTLFSSNISNTSNGFNITQKHKAIISNKIIDSYTNILAFSNPSLM